MFGIGKKKEEAAPVVEVPTRRPVAEIIATLTSIIGELEDTDGMIDVEATECSASKEAEEARHQARVKELDEWDKELQSEQRKAKTVIANLSAILHVPDIDEPEEDEVDEVDEVDDVVLPEDSSEAD